MRVALSKIYDGCVVEVRHVSHTVAHEAGGLTASFIYPILIAIADITLGPPSDVPTPKTVKDD